MGAQLRMRKAKFIFHNYFSMIFSGFMLMGTLASYAQTWVEVGNGFYADKESAHRSGEIGHITLSNMTMPSLLNMKFDCKRNIAFIPGKPEPRNTNDNPILRNSQELACRRSWELWK
jgi:hypothetical protein